MTARTTVTLIVQLFMLAVSQAWSDSEKECPHLVDQRIFSPSFKLPNVTEYRAYRTLPRGFSLRPSTIPGAGMGVFVDVFLPRHSWLGDYQGVTVYTRPRRVRQCASHNRYLWRMQYNGYNVVNVDAEHLNSSNWLRWINCARNCAELNVSSHQCFGKILYRTSRDLAPGTELLVFYGVGFAHSLGINLKQFYNVTHGRQLAHVQGLWYSKTLKAV